MAQRRFGIGGIIRSQEEKCPSDFPLIFPKRFCKQKLFLENIKQGGEWHEERATAIAMNLWEGASGASADAPRSGAKSKKQIGPNK